MATSIYENQVYTLFLGYFGRPPAPSGLAYYTSLMDQSGGNWLIIADDFYNSPESQALFGGKSVEAQVNQIFQNLFGRDAAAAGLNYWTGEVLAGRVSLPGLAYTVAYNAQEDDVAVRDAKIETSRLWVESLDTTEEILAFQTDAGRQSARDFLATVTTDTPATQEQVDNAIEDMVQGGGGNPGQTFTLTNSTITGSFDNLNGTSGNDTYVAGPATLETGDVINGGAGTDRLNATFTADATVAPTLTSIEQVFVRSLGNGVDSVLNLSNSTGVTQAWADRVEDEGGGEATVTFTNLSKSVTAGIAGGPTTAANRGTATWNFNDVTGSADEATLVVDNGRVTAATLNGVETLNINSIGGSNNIGTLNATELTKLVVTGDKNLTIGATDFNAAAAAGVTVDASAFTGDLNITFSEAGKQIVKGGSGNDSVYMAGLLNAGDDIDGGTGTNTIGIVNPATLTADTGKLLKNFQVFDAKGATVGTFDMDFIKGAGTTSTINAVKVTGALAGAVQIDNLAVGAGVTIAASTGANNLTVNQKGQADAGRNSDSLSYTLEAPATGGDITVANLITADVETINITSKATAGVTAGHTITASTFGGATTIKFSGDEQLTFTTLGAAAATNIDASAMTDKFIMTNASTAATVLLLKGGSADDTLRIDSDVQLTGSVVQGGGGSDTIVIANSGGEVTTLKYVAQSDSTATKYDKVTGLVTAEDKIDISAFGIEVAARAAFDVSAKVTSTGTLAGANLAFEISAANAVGFFSNAGANRGVAIEDTGTDNIIFVDVNKDGNYSAADDLVIVVGGITGGGSLVTGDFIFV